jgi:hypothetical protein
LLEELFVLWSGGPNRNAAISCQLLASYSTGPTAAAAAAAAGVTSLLLLLLL